MIHGNRLPAICVSLCESNQNPEHIRHYWEAHRSDPDGNIYYAYYTLFANSSAFVRRVSGRYASYPGAPETKPVVSKRKKLSRCTVWASKSSRKMRCITSRWRNTT